MNDAFPLQAIDDSDLFGALKAGRLKGPNALAYDAKDWIEFSATLENPTTRDINLLLSALHFGLEFGSLRWRMKDELPRLAPADAVDFVIAGLNVQTNAVISRSSRQLRKQARSSDVMYMGDGGNIRIQNSGRQDLNPDDAMAVLVDGLANLLFHIIDTDRSPSASDRSQAILNAQKITTLVSIEHGLKELWGRAVWDGCTIEKIDKLTVFAVGNEAFAKLWLAWQRRFETIILQENRLTAGEALVRDDRTARPPLLTRTVVGLEDRSGRKKEYIIGKARHSGNEQAFALSAVEATYLKSFLDEVLPNHRETSLTYRDLWRAWWVLQDIAKIHQARMPSRGCLSWKEVSRCALHFSVPRAVKAIAAALNISHSAADTAMRIFTTDPDIANRKVIGDIFQNGTWGRPVVRIKNEDRGRISLASIISPNPIMMMERWMTRTGMMDDPKGRNKKTVRGKVFERVAREKIRASASKNDQLTGFHIAYLSTRGEGSEEIDAIFKLGSTIAVCEMKCLNVPLEPLGRYNHLGKIQEAVDQVNRKVEWSRTHATAIFDALSVPEEERGRTWQFVPIVVLNSTYGAGLAINGCAVTDLDWLSTFLGSPEIVVGGTFERRRGASLQSRSVYRDQADLERRFIEIAVSPPSLASELGRIEWELAPFPTRSGEPLAIQVPVSKNIPDLGFNI